MLEQAEANRSMMCPESLTLALIRQGVMDDDARVKSAEVSVCGVGNLGDSYLVVPEYLPAQAGPDQVFAKLPPSDPDAARLDAMINAHARESWFYGEVAETLDVRTPRLLGFVGVEGRPQGLLLEDLSRERGADQFAGATAQDAQVAVGELARLHGSTWRRGDLTGHPSLFDRFGRIEALRERYRSSWTSHGNLIVDQLDSDQCALIARFEVSCESWAESATGPEALIHQDFRLDNLIFANAGAWVIDWQLVGWGPVAADLAYFIATSLPTRVRRDTERQLVQHYLETAQQIGHVPWTFDQLWSAYRHMSLYALLALVPSMAHVRQSKRATDMYAVMLDRATRHALDLDAGELIA